MEPNTVVRTRPIAADLRGRAVARPAESGVRNRPEELIEEREADAIDDGSQGSDERIAELEAELDAQRELIATLTTRLEEAAEQLDRWQHNSPAGQRGGRGAAAPNSSTGLSPQLIADLTRMVTQWDEMQASMSLGRIEVQLAELRDLILQRPVMMQEVPTTRSVAQGPAATSHSRRTLEEVVSRAAASVDRAAQAEERTAFSSPAASRNEQILRTARLLQEAEPEATQQEEELAEEVEELEEYETAESAADDEAEFDDLDRAAEELAGSLNQEATPPEPEPNPALATWAALRAQMITSDPPPASPRGSDIPGRSEKPSRSASLDRSVQMSEAAEQEEVLDGSEFPAPRPINLAVATPDDIRQALDERDAYIAYLIRRLRSSEDIPSEAWNALLEASTKEQRSAVDELIGQLEDKLKLAEIETSMERARLSREQMKLQADQELVDKHMRRLGLKAETTKPDGGKEAGGKSTASSDQDRRWNRFLGKR